jgi:hypothetical protein
MTEVVGYAAASAVLASFLMRSMVPLRLVAILSNILFLSYGYLADIAPVLVLHAALLPINVARLAITQRDGKGFGSTKPEQISCAGVRQNPPHRTFRLGEWPWVRSECERSCTSCSPFSIKARKASSDRNFV